MYSPRPAPTPTPPGRRPPRAAALLIVLATLVLVTTAAVSLARLASAERMRRNLDDDSIATLDLLEAAEAPILHWLQTEASSVVLPPDARQPVVPVLHDAWRHGDELHVLRIAAWDQSGMVGHDVIHAGSPLRLAIPADALRVIDKITVPDRTTMGLDLVARMSDAGEAVYPVAPEVPRVWFGADASLDEPSPQDEPREPVPLALGALVASHNPGVINVNTAPVDLLEAALRSEGRGGTEVIVAARDRGEAAPLPPPVDRDRRGDRKLEFVSSSPAWGFRIDATCGPLQRSWWAVYVRGGGSKGGWRCAQRLAIP